MNHTFTATITEHVMVPQDEGPPLVTATTDEDQPDQFLAFTLSPTAMLESFPVGSKIIIRVEPSDA